MTLPTTNSDDFVPDEERLAEVLDRYVSDRREGKTVSHDEMIERHPSLAMELRECLPSVDFLDSPSSEVNTELIKSLAEFEIIETIGRGGMGIVYRARQKSLDREVALKVMRVGIVDEEALQRFSREAMTTAALHHTNIVPIHAVGHAEGVHFYAMQLIEGRSLAQVAASMRDTSPENVSTTENQTDPEKPSYHTIIDWGLQAADALAHAHSRNVIHRDVKPSNLILDADNRVWLTDFGLAKRLDDVNATITSAILGTPRYMSPEQASGIASPIDHRTDLYSLGATLYELLTGKPVFDGDSPLKIMDSIRSDDIVRPRDVRSDLPRDIDAVVMKCLERRPSDRYDSAEQLASDLRAITEHRPVSVKPPNQLMRWKRKLDGHKRDVTLVAAVMATCAVLFLAIVKGTVYYTNSTRTELMFTSTDGPYSTKFVTRLPGREKAYRSFTIPMQSHLTIESGQHELRMTRSGWPSDKAFVTLAAGEERELPFKPMEEKRWTTPLTEQTVRPLTLDENLTPVRFSKDSIARLDLNTGKDLWSIDVATIKHQELRWTDRKNPQHDEARRKQEWQAAIDRPLRWVLRTDTPPTGPLAFSQPPLMLGDACDLNGDNHDDVVITARDESALAAISGMDGSVIWAARYHFPDDVDPPVKEPTPRPGFASITRVADTNDDGVDDLLCQPMRFITADDAFRGTALVSGKTGEVLWSLIDTTCNVAKFPPDQNRNGPFAEMDWPNRDRLNPHTYNFGQRSMSAIHFDRPFAYRNNTNTVTMPMPPIVGQHATSREVILFEPTDPRSTSPKDPLISESMYKTRTVELASGIPTEKPAFFVDCATSSRPVTIDNDSNRAKLFVGSPRLATGSALPYRKFPPIELKLLDVVSGKVLWSKDIHADWRYRDLPSASTWPLVVDLDGDGTDEIVVPDQDAFWEDTEQASLKILDGSTGKLRSETQPIFTSLPQIDFVTDTIDIDGDGARDLVTATLFRAIGLDTCGDLHLDAFSSANGNHLWHYEFDAFEGSVFDQAITGICTASSQPDDQSTEYRRDASSSEEWIEVQLVRPSSNRDMERSRTLALDPRSGEVISDLVGLSPITPAGNADVPRLFLEDFDARQQSVHNRLLATTNINRGSWTIAGGGGMVVIERGQDLDDLIVNIKTSQPNSALTCMTQTGETIWTKSHSIHSWPNIIQQLKVWADRPTLFVATRTPSIDGLPCLIDANTGKEIWRIKGAARVPARPIQLDSRDLDADGKPEIIYVAVQLTDDSSFQGRPTDSATIYCISGATGRIVWEREILAGIAAPNMPEVQDSSSWSPGQGAALSALVTADFNQDGTQDVVIADTKDAERVLTAIDGKSGELLWQHSLVGSVDRYRMGDVPRPVVLEVAEGAPLIGLTDLAADQSGVNKRGVRVTLKLINGKDGHTLDSREEVVHKDWSRRQAHSIRHHRGRFILHSLPDKETDEQASEPDRRSQRLGYLVQRPDFSQDYYVFEVADRQLKQALSIKVFDWRKNRDDQWLQCWLEPSSSNMLVTTTKKQCTRYNLSSGETDSQVKWDSSCGSLGSVEGVRLSNGRQRIIGRCLGDYTTLVSMNVDDGSIAWRLPIYRSSGGNPWGSFGRLFHRAGDRPPRIALNSLYNQTVLQTIGTGKPLAEQIANSSSWPNESVLEDRRGIRNLRGPLRSETSTKRAVASLVSIVFGLGIFVIPYVYLRKLLSKQVSLRFFFAAFPVVAIALATLGLSTPATPKMWPTASTPLVNLTYGLFGTILIVALFVVLRSAFRRRWLAPVLAALFLIVANSYSVAMPIVEAWTKSPSIRYKIQWTHFIDPSLAAISAFGLACIIVFGIKGLWQVGVSLLNRHRTIASSAETNLGEGQPS